MNGAVKKDATAVDERVFELGCALCAVGRLRSVLSGSGKPVARVVPGEQTMLTLESFGIPVLLQTPRTRIQSFPCVILSDRRSGIESRQPSVTFKHVAPDA